MKNRLFTLAAALTLAAVLGGVYAAPALAAVIKAALVKDVDEPARHFVSFEFAPGYAPSYTVPIGQILVIEWVGAVGVPAGGSYMLAYAEGDVGTASNTHRWTAQFAPVGGLLHQQVRLYAKGGQKVTGSFFGAVPQLFVQGYLLDEN